MINFKKEKFVCCVLGLGYIGLPTAALIANTNNKVIGVDINQKVVDLVNKGKIHIIENGLEKLVKDVIKSGYLVAQTKPSKADVFLLAVPTPLEMNADGMPKPNIDFVLKAAKSITKFIEPGNLIILESTSPVGTTEKVAELLSKESGIPIDQISIAYCPERVLPGNALKEIISNNRVVGGLDKNSANKGENFYQSFCQSEVIKTNARTAELVKLAENASRDVNIAFANELSIISEELGINHREVIEIANKHPRVQILKPGCGVGGHCIAIDPWFIASQCPENSKLIQTARNVNKYKTIWSIKLIKNRIKNLEINLNRKAIVGIFGLTFKQDIDDIRESPALLITEKLIEEGHSLIVCEPNISKFSNIKLYSYEETVNRSDILVFLVAHYQFKDLNFKNKDIIDLCGIL
tara:strand:- start:6914 stop:8140 length:1227 start_codon:yes stop_codon:yes gene_type:complete